MKKLLLIFFILFFSSCNLYAQIKTIKGRVIDDSFETLPGVSISIDDTLKIGKTDINGFYQIEIPFSSHKISFNGVGIETAVINLSDDCAEVEVIMPLASTYDFMSLKKVDKERFKVFKKLPKLHKEAFEKGIFKTSTPCYTREFIPRYKKLQ